MFALFPNSESGFSILQHVQTLEAFKCVRFVSIYFELMMQRKTLPDLTKGRECTINNKCFPCSSGNNRKAKELVRR